MEKKFNKGNQSNYEITLIFSNEEQVVAKNKAFDHFRKDLEVPGFRKGKAPNNMVEEKVRPEYISLVTFEQLIDSGLKSFLEENKEMKFIGEPYNLDQKPEKDTLTITCTLDVYPEVEVKDDAWKKHKMKKIDAEPKQTEIEEAMNNLKKNYADYKDTDTIEDNTVAKVSMEFLNTKGESIDKGSLFVGEREFADGKFFQDTFIGKKKNEEFNVSYDKKKLPPTMHAKKEGTKEAETSKDEKIAKVKLKVLDIKKVVLPKFTDENVKKFFGEQSEVQTTKELAIYIKKEIMKQKHDIQLMTQIEDFLKKSMENSMKVSIPQTLIKEENKSRMKNLEEKFGGKEKVDEYFKQLGEKKKKEFLDDIAKAARESLEKFFILQKTCELLEIKADFQNSKSLEIEKKLHKKLLK